MVVLDFEGNLEKILREITIKDAASVWKSKKSKPLFDYRYEHTKAVVITAKHLQKIEGGDIRVIVASAWLHDISKKFFHKDSDFHHGKKSAEMSEPILKNLNFNDNEIQSVKEVIKNHVGLFKDSIDRNIESKIIWDADKLTKVGAVSVAHAFSIAPAFEAVTTEGILERGLQWAKTVEKIVESFHTIEAVKLGKERLKFLKSFYHQLKCEFEME